MSGWENKARSVIRPPAGHSVSGGLAGAGVGQTVQKGPQVFGSDQRARASLDGFQPALPDRLKQRRAAHAGAPAGFRDGEGQGGIRVCDELGHSGPSFR
jgi:hypothetical protein